jgi:hypothetical protein
MLSQSRIIQFVGVVTVAPGFTDDYWLVSGDYFINISPTIVQKIAVNSDLLNTSITN